MTTGLASTYVLRPPAVLPCISESDGVAEGIAGPGMKGGDAEVKLGVDLVVRGS